MNNEELAQRIKEGQKEYLAPLWTNMRRLIVKWANAYYGKYKDRLEGRGVTQEDLEQQGYFALLEAVKAYDPSTGWKLTTYLSFPLQKAFHELAGLRTSRQREDVLSKAISLDAPICGTGEEIRLMDALEDTGGVGDIEAVTERIYTEQLRADLEKALGEIRPEHAALLRGRYFEGKTVAQLDEVGTFPIPARYLEANALRAIRAPKARKHIQKYREEIISRSYRRIGLSAFRHTWTSATEWAGLELCEISPPARTDREKFCPGAVVNLFQL